MIWRARDTKLDLTDRALVMGVLNLTPDSFSDGGSYATVHDAVERALAMEAEGADIIDIGGESTRPGAEPVDAEEEMRRVLPVLEKLRGRTRCLLSIDTCKAAVARSAIERGAEIINDVTALRGDPEMRRVAAETGAAVILMHMQGTPRTMQINPVYEDVVAEVADFFRQSFSLALASGVDPVRVAFDPGIGFGKSVGHNLKLLNALDRLGIEGRPLVIGVSRKSFLGRVLGSQGLSDRLWPTVALTAWSRERGARIVRVHDVRPNTQALRMAEAILLE